MAEKLAAVVWRPFGLLVATPTRLIYLIEVPPLLRVKAFEYPFERVAHVALERGKEREESNLLVRVDVPLLRLQMYSGESTQFRMYERWHDQALSILNVIHSRTEDGVVDLYLARAGPKGPSQG